MSDLVRLSMLASLLACANAAVAAHSVTVDPAFAYYKERSNESIVEEIKANGFDDVRLACVNESGINGALVKAFADSDIKVWMLTFANGVYSTVDLPKGWESWKMKTRKPSNPDGFTYLCPNNASYREWKKKQVTTALNAHPFSGVDLCEAFLPAYPGPESQYYGCLCESCAAAFKKMCPDAIGIPDFEDKKSPQYWSTDKELYEKWVAFRVATVVGFLDDLVNGKDGIREKCPTVKVCTWSLGLDVPDQLAKLREWEGLDGAAIARRVKPDAHMIQTDWPDWIKDNLRGDYPLKYKAVAESIRDAAPRVTLMLQADIGSKQNMRRDRDWMKQVEKYAKQIHCETVTYYEYHIGEYIYTETPAVVSATSEPGTVKLVFNKRLEPMAASNVSNYSVSSGRVDFARADGNIVKLSVSGVETGATLTISGLSDDESRRLFHDKPACLMTESVEVMVE